MVFQHLSHSVIDSTAQERRAFASVDTLDLSNVTVSVG